MHEEKYLKLLEDKLLKKSKKHAIELNWKWKLLFPNEPGVYAIFRNEELLWVGETGNIRKRMSDLSRTLNHSFRRILGNKIYGEMATSRKKFSDDVEQKLDDYFRKNLKVSFLVVTMGRLELEEMIIDKYRDKGIYNVKEKRK
jgi:hypothetical protein